MNKVDNYVDVIDHVYESVVTDPTCTEEGYTTHTCSECNHSYVDSIVDPLGHDFGDWTEIEGDENGEETHIRHCSRCGASETKPHVYVAAVTYPTCTDRGYTTYTCACGYVKVDDYKAPLGHSMGAWVETNAPTCTEEGAKRRDCEACDRFETEVVPATGHSYEVTVTDPTCEKHGYTTHTCACGETYKDNSVPATGHSYESTVTPPTCEAEGYTTHVCSACNHTYVDARVSATGHSMGAWVETDAPTCTEEGAKRRDCEACDYFETEVVPATGHSYESTVTPPTCEAEGYTTHVCSACDHTYVDARVSATGHSYESTVTPPTCEAEGYTTHVCSACDHTYVDARVSATGHSMGAWVETDAPTCTEEGAKRRDCTACDHFETEVVPATGHSYNAVVTAPTCTEEGYTTYTCACSYTYKDDSVDATGHKYYDVTTAPTCTEAGYTTSTCTVCGDSYIKDEKAALGHSIVTKSNGNGTHANTCTRCDESEDENCSGGAATCTSAAICEKCKEYYGEALGHAWDEGTVSTAPKCEKAGVLTKSCTNGCGLTTTETIPATGHSYSKEVIAPTCESQGYTAYTCACGATYNANYVAPTGHTWAESEVTKAPTCTETGVMTYTCHCGETKTEEISALGHSYESTVTPPTCEAEGYTTHVCSACNHTYVDTRVSATGHSMGDWEETVAPTCTQAGAKRRDCTACDHFETEVVPAKGHSYKIEVTAPKCEEQGYTIHTCSACGDTYESDSVPALGHTWGEGVVPVTA